MGSSNEKLLEFADTIRDRLGEEKGQGKIGTVENMVYVGEQGQDEDLWCEERMNYMGYHRNRVGHVIGSYNEVRGDSPVVVREVDSKKVRVKFDGKIVRGSHRYVKRRLLRLGTKEAFEAASLLDSPIVKVRCGKKKIKGSVNDVATQVQEYVDRILIFRYSIDPNMHRNIDLPREALELIEQGLPFPMCPTCGGIIEVGTFDGPNTPMLRGIVQRWSRVWYAPWKTRPYCAVICPHCKEIIGWESPGDECVEIKKLGPFR